MSGPLITFLSHTARPGGAELALGRYLRATRLPVRLVTMAQGAVWDDLPCPVTHAPSLPQVAKVLREDDGPVVANSMRAALYAALVVPRRRTLVYWVRDGLTESAMSPLALALTRQVTARRVRHYLANSEWTAGTVRSFLGVPSQRVTVVTSMSGVHSREIARRTRRSQCPVRLLYLGRIADWKAPDVAVQALSTLHGMGIDARLSIVGAPLFGEKGYAERLRAVVSREPRAQLAGHSHDVPGILSSHDVLVHTSRIPEPFGQVVVQALGAGMPVVVSRGGGPEEIIAGAPVDLTYPGGSPEGLAAAVMRVLSSYQDTSAWASQRAMAFADEILAPRTDAVLASL